MLRALCVFLAMTGGATVAEEHSADKIGARFGSPQAVWDAYRSAQHEGRWGDAFRCATKQAQRRFLGRIVFAAAYLQRTQAKESAARVKAILKDHGLDLDIAEAAAESTPDEHALDEFIDKVKDKERLYAEAMNELGRVPRGLGEAKKERAMVLGKLKRITIAGDQARGKYVEKLKDNEVFMIGGIRQTEVEMEAQFRKIDGQWLVHEGVEGVVEE